MRQVGRIKPTIPRHGACIVAAGLLVFGLFIGGVRDAQAERPLTSSRIRPSKRGPSLSLAPRDAPIGVLRVEFRSGAVADGHRPGLTKLTLHAMLAANDAIDYEELKLALFSSAATLEVETGMDRSAITLTSPASAFGALAEKVAKLCLTPKLSASDLDRAKAIARQAETRSEQVRLSSLFVRGVRGAPKYSNDPEGDDEVLQDISLKDLNKHLAGPMSPAKARIILTGTFDAPRMKALFAHFPGAEDKDKPPAVAHGDLAGRYQAPGIQRMTLLGHTLDFSSPKAIAAAYLTRNLLDHRVRSRADTSLMPLRVELIHEKSLDALVVAYAHAAGAQSDTPVDVAAAVAEIRGGAFSEEELEDGRKAVRIELTTIDRDPRALAEALAIRNGQFAGLSPEVVDALDQITKAELLDAIKADLAPERAILVSSSPTEAGATPARGTP